MPDRRPRGPAADPRFVLLADSVPIALYETDAAGRCLRVNRRWTELCGLAQEEAPGDGWARGLDPEDRERIVAGWRRCVAAGAPWEGEYRFRRPDGEVRWVLGSARPLRDAAGALTGYLGSNLDITDRKAVEEALRASEARFRSVFEHSLDAILLTRPGGVVLAANPAACRMLGRSEAEICRLGREGLVDPADPRVGELLARRDREGRARGPVTMLRADGSLLEVEVASEVFPGEDGAPRTILILRDLSEVQAARAALEDSEARFRGMVEKAGVGVWQADAQGRTTYVNAAMARMLGVEPSAMAGRTAAAFVFPEDLEDHRARVAERPRGIAGQYERRVRRPDGSTLWLLVTGTPLHDEAGGFAGTLGLCTDITERHRADELARAFSHRLLAAREDERQDLATRLHHDLGSLSVGVSARLEAAREGLREGRAADALALLDEGVRAFEAGISQLRSLAVTLRPPTLDLLGLAEALRQHANQVRAAGVLEVRFEDRLAGAAVRPDVETVLFRVAQEALTNVVRHARAKVVEVRLDRTRAGLCLSVRDDGCGFEPGEALASPTGRIGLRSMLETTHGLGGGLSLESAPGRGTFLAATVPAWRREP